MTEADLYTRYRGVYVPAVLHPPQCLRYYENFTFRPDDVLIVTFPKSGTTWTQEIVPQVMNKGDPTLVETIPNWDRVPWLEEQRASTLALEEWPSPRTFTSHFSHNLMPTSYFQVKPKVIYVMRNPKDVFTSMYHYSEMASFLVNPGTTSDFVQKFLDGEVIFGSWFDHVKSWLNVEHTERILYVAYEDMVKDLKAVVAEIAGFLEQHLSSEVTEKIAERCLFKNMKQNPMSNYSLVPAIFMDQSKSTFLRKGIAGDWKNLLTAEEEQHFDAVFKEKMKDVKYRFAWD